jgi:hypothetical protein
MYDSQILIVLEDWKYYIIMECLQHQVFHSAYPSDNTSNVLREIYGTTET